MTISNDYFSRLTRYSDTTFPVSSLLDQTGSPDNMVALRHDIDHDLDIALDFAFEEHKRGYRATYFLLHDHDYCNDDLFVDKVLQIQDYGHEVGLHLNVLAGWASERFENPSQHLLDWLTVLRDAGVSISGCATHGDRRCYELNVINYWYFKEQFVDKADYLPKSPEGIIGLDKQNLIPYPERPKLVRADGTELNLWEASMKDFGLSYEAVDIPCHYWSDTGKDWHRTGDPLGHDLCTGKHQILMHPVHWLGKPRQIFFLSAARSGSKWTAKMVEQVSSADIRHEWTLNHRKLNGKEVQEKFTTLDSVGLKKKNFLARDLICHSFSVHKRKKRNQIEFNVYLADYTEEVKSIFPNAEFFGLIRSGRDVIPSLLLRKWYATPKSIRYPVDSRFQYLNQFQKSCMYWHDANEKMLLHAKTVFKLEDISSSRECFANFLKCIDFPVHKRLVSRLDFSPLDSSSTDKIKKYKIFNRRYQNDFIQICSGMMKHFNYENVSQEKDKKRNILENFQRTLSYKIRHIIQSLYYRNKDNPEFQTDLLEGCFSMSRNLLSTKKNNMRVFSLDRQDSPPPCWILFDSSGHSTWSCISDISGMNIQDDDLMIHGKIEFQNKGYICARLFYLEYNEKGRLVYNKLLAFLSQDWRGRFSEKVPCSSGTRFCIGIHITDFGSSSNPMLVLKRCDLKLARIPSHYSFSTCPYEN